VSQGPYAVPRADPTNVMGQRIGAYAIDTLIATLVVIAVGLPVFFAQVDRASTKSTDYCTSYKNEHSGGFCVTSAGTAYTMTSSKVSKLSQAFYGAVIGWTLLNAAILQGITGGTIGKLLLGLRVVRSDGRHAGIGRCLVRTVLLILIDSLCFIIGLVLSLSTSGHRRVGDMVASTLVVRKEDEGQPVGAAVAGVAGVGGPWAPSDNYRPPPSTGAQPAGDGPTWDPARNTYIQYDRSRSAWVQWDDRAKEWKPIDQG
jgi:uncharacterized RDD family membrane protein YckC